MRVAGPRVLTPRSWSTGVAVVACTVVLALLGAPPASATTVVSVNLAQMTARADLVVRGWVANVEPRREANGQIYTYVTLEGVEVIHGTYLQSTLELRFSGGELEGERSYIVGMPTFSVGEHVLLFVRGNGSEMCPIVGWHQGRFRVAADPDTGTEYLTDAVGHPVVDVAADSVIRYGPRSGEAPNERGSAGIPDDPAATVGSVSSVPASPPMPLASFLAAVDRLRGVAPLPAAEPLAESAAGIPVDALAPASVVESARPVLGRPEIPMALPDRETVDEE